MEKNEYNIRNAVFSMPSFFQKVDSVPGDPEDSIPFMVKTENAECLVIVYPVDFPESMPRDVSMVISGIRQALGDNQGMIKVDAGEDYVYSIVKTLKEPSGVQYTLTYQRPYEDFVLNFQGYFDEINTTGMRDTMVFEIFRREQAGGENEDPFEGWTCDPYDEKIGKGALMNISEQERFDEMFPGFPLSMCRELVRFLNGEE